jgi:hypothetical protein
MVPPRTQFLALLLAWSLIVPLLVARTAGAQEATPTLATDVTLPISPDPEAWCTVEPRPLAEVRAMWEEVNAVPSDATPSAYPAPLEKPSGEPADEQTVMEITTAVVTVIGCANANSGLADASLVTDRHLSDSNNLLGLPQEDFEAYYTESPIPSEPAQWLMVYSVHDVIMLADGRVGAEPEVIVPGDGHYCDDYLIFANEGGRWLIDFSYYGPNCYPVG